jgi:putative MFS transporter
MKHLELFGIFALIPHALLSLICPESPRWLMTKGRLDEAKKIIKKILKWNKLPESNLDMVKGIENPLKRANVTHILRHKGMRRNFLAMGVCWLATAMGYYGLIFYTPAFDWNVYLVFVFPTFFLIPTEILMPAFENK